MTLASVSALPGTPFSRQTNLIDLGVQTIGEGKCQAMTSTYDFYDIKPFDLYNRSTNEPATIFDTGTDD